MSRSGKSFLGLVLAAGLCTSALEAAPKPKPPAPTLTCPGCPIVYVQTREFGSIGDLMLMMADGSDKTVVLAGERGVMSQWPVWAPDGEWITVSSNRDGVYRSWLVKWDGTNPTPVLPSCVGEVLFFAWRPVPVPGTETYWLVYSSGAVCDSRDPWKLQAVQVDLSTTPPEVSPDSFCLTCDGDLGPYLWGNAAWTSDGMHLSALRAEGNPYTYEYVIFDFVVDEAGPHLVSGRELGLAGLGLAGLDGDWAHGRNRLIAEDFSLTSGLWWFDIDHDAETMVLDGGWGYLPGEDGWGYGSPHWSPNDGQLLYSGGSSDVGGLFVAPFDSFPLSATVIAPSTKKGQARHASWNPNPQRP